MMARTVDEIFNEIELRIRTQVGAAEMLSMEWRMGMACLAHVAAVRLEENKATRP